MIIGHGCLFCPACFYFVDGTRFANRLAQLLFTEVELGKKAMRWVMGQIGLSPNVKNLEEKNHGVSLGS